MEQYKGATDFLYHYCFARDQIQVNNVMSGMGSFYGGECFSH